MGCTFKITHAFHTSVTSVLYEIFDAIDQDSALLLKPVFEEQGI